MITKAKCLRIYETKENVAEVLGITPEEVDAWPEGQIPVCHMLMLRYICAPVRFRNDRLPQHLTKRIVANQKVAKRLHKKIE